MDKIRKEKQPSRKIERTGKRTRRKKNDRKERELRIENFSILSEYIHIEVGKNEKRESKE